MTTLQVVQKFYPQVTTVKDATKPIFVEVTNADTKSRAVKNHKECAFAVACKRQGADAAIVAIKVAYLVKGTTATRYYMPEHLSREVVVFDREGQFAAGEYWLNPPEVKIGQHNVGRKGPHSKSPKKIYTATKNIRNIGEIV